jgi:hypothetical protein
MRRRGTDVPFPTRQEDRMGKHWDFFKESDRSWGVFYPRNYIVAGYGSLERADAVRAQLIERGFAADDVAAASGEFVVRELETDRDPGWLDRLRQEIASAVGTELGYVEDDLRHARQGGAFLFVYVPRDEDVISARAVIDASQPVHARRYMALGIERYTYPPQSELAFRSAQAVRRA